MFRVAQVASYDQHPDVPSVRSVDDGVGEVLQWMNAAEFVCGCANVREPKQQFRDAFELVEEAVCPDASRRLDYPRRGFIGCDFS